MAVRIKWRKKPQVEKTSGNSLKQKSQKIRETLEDRGGVKYIFQLALKGGINLLPALPVKQKCLCLLYP